MGMPEPQEMRNLMRAGRKGDSELAHVNPHEAMVLEMMGGSGSVNPRTGLREYYESGSGPGGRDTTSDNARDTAGPSQQDTGGTTSSGDSFLDRVVNALTPDLKGWSDPLGKIGNTFMDPKTAGPAIAGLFGGTPFGGIAMGMQALNDRYAGGQARADVDQGKYDKNESGMGLAASPDASGGQFYGQGVSSPFSFGPVSDWRYQANNPTAPTQGRMQFLTALNRVTDPAWRKEKVGFGTGDELLDTIFNPLQTEAMDYLTRAQTRGMLDVPSYNAALEVLRSQGGQGRQQLAQRLNEQGDSIIQPLRARAAELQGQIAGGQYDTTPFSDSFFDELFGGAINEVKSRAGEVGTDYNPYAPATALYMGLDQGGDVRGSPLISTLRTRNRNAPIAGRGIGSRGIF